MGEIQSAGDGNGDHVTEITVKTIGAAPPFCLKVPSSIKVLDLRKCIAVNGHLPIENLTLILKGKVLQDEKNGVDELIFLNNGDSLLVAVKPKPPVKHSTPDGLDDDDEDDDDLKFQLPLLTSAWKRRTFCFLHDKMRIPDMLLMAVFSMSIKMWILIISWFILAPVAHRWDLGPLYCVMILITLLVSYPLAITQCVLIQMSNEMILATGFAIIFLNLGQRQQGDMSAYSIFNENFRELPGTLNADRLDQDIRAGQF